MNKPNGQWRCRACGREWHGDQLYDNPISTAVMWTCADLGCGGVCDRIIIDDDMRTMPPERINQTLSDMDSEEANEFLEQLGTLRAGMIYAAQPPSPAE